MYLFVCIHMYINIYIYIHTNICMYVHIFLNMVFFYENDKAYVKIALAGPRLIRQVNNPSNSLELVHPAGMKYLLAKKIIEGPFGQAF